MKFYSPLRYPGGKSKLAKFMQIIVKLNDLFDGTYVEPFAGGAGIALSLLFNEFMSNIIINDIDKSIYAFWYSVLNHTEQLCKLIYDTPLTLEEWQRQRYLQQHPDDVSILELGFSTFFLNRTNRSGIIKAGIIGGKSQNGKYKMSARFNKKDLINRIEKISAYKDRIKLYNLDAAEFIEQVLNRLPYRTLIYFDPPYYNKGPELYENHYRKEDHAYLAQLIKEKVEHKWIITYDNTPEVYYLYNEYRKKVYSLNYSAATKTKGSEIMIFSNNLAIPNIENPIKVKLKD